MLIPFISQPGMLYQPILPKFTIVLFQLSRPYSDPLGTSNFLYVLSNPDLDLHPW